MPLLVIASVRFPPEHMERVRAMLKQMVIDTNTKDGCIYYSAAEDVSVPGTVRFSELWPDRETLVKHLDAPHIAPWRALSAELGAFDRDARVWDASNERPLASMRQATS